VRGGILRDVGVCRRPSRRAEGTLLAWPSPRKRGEGIIVLAPGAECLDGLGQLAVGLLAGGRHRLEGARHRDETRHLHDRIDVGRLDVALRKAPAHEIDDGFGRLVRHQRGALVADELGVCGNLEEADAADAFAVLADRAVPRDLDRAAIGIDLVGPPD